MGVNVGEEGRTHKTNEPYSVELWFAPAAQPHWHVFSRSWHNICLGFFFYRIPKGIFKKLHSSPSARFQPRFCRASQAILVFYLKSWLRTVEKKPKKHFHWTSYNPPSNFCKAFLLMGRAQAKIQHLSSQRSNKALKSRAFTIIQYRKASRNPLLSQVVRTSSSLFLNFSSF